MISKLIDMELFPCLEIEVKQGELITIKDLSSLSKREKEVYKLHKYKLISLKEIAIELNISASSVQTYISRANNKLNEV